MSCIGTQSFPHQPPSKICINMKTTGKYVKNSNGTHAGRWTREEHEQFLVGLQKYGREWKKVASLIQTRTSSQVRI